MAMLISGLSEIEEVSFGNITRPEHNAVDLSTNMEKELAEAFKKFDNVGDGKTSPVEIRAVLHSLEETHLETEWNRILQDVDADGDHEIDLLEFITLNSKSLLVSSSKTGGDDEKSGLGDDHTARGTKMRIKGGKSFWCSFLLGLAFVADLPLARANSESPSGTSDHSAWFFVGIAAAIIGPVIAAISLGVTIYYHRRERVDGLVGALDILTRPFREPLGGLYIAVGSLKVGEKSIDDLVIDSRVESNPGDQL